MMYGYSSSKNVLLGSRLFRFVECEATKWLMRETHILTVGFVVTSNGPLELGM
jgi:hypothetical protein